MEYLGILQSIKEERKIASNSEAREVILLQYSRRKKAAAALPCGAHVCGPEYHRLYPPFARKLLFTNKIKESGKSNRRLTQNR